MFDGPDGAEIFPGNASKFDISKPEGADGASCWALISRLSKTTIDNPRWSEAVMINAWVVPPSWSRATIITYLLLSNHIELMWFHLILIFRPNRITIKILSIRISLDRDLNQGPLPYQVTISSMQKWFLSIFIIHGDSMVKYYGLQQSLLRVGRVS